MEPLPRPSYRYTAKENDNNKHDNKDLLEFRLNIILKVRGGSIKSLSADEQDDVDDENDSIVVRKVRTIVRSLLKATKGSALGDILQSLVGTFQAVTGVKLLPVKRKKKSKSKSKKAPPTKTSSSTKEQVAGNSSKVSKWEKKEIKSTSPNYRIQRELKAFLAEPPTNLSVKVGKNLRVWIVTMKGAANTIYEGETFKLRIAFPAQYPQVPPSVYFLPPNIPVHEHVYTNGDICLSLLGKDWRPTMTAQSIAVSILSILSSAQSKSLPMDNARHAQNRPGQYQKDWVYHDDKVSK